MVWKPSKGSEARNFSSTNFKVNIDNRHIHIYTYTFRYTYIYTYTYTQHLKNTNIQEHIHVYQPMEGGADAGVFAAPFHTDNGLLLMVTPFQV